MSHDQWPHWKNSIINGKFFSSAQRLLNLENYFDFASHLHKANQEFFSKFSQLHFCCYYCDQTSRNLPRWNEGNFCKPTLGWAKQDRWGLISKGITGSIHTLLQYTMTLLQFSKDPVLPTLINTPMYDTTWFWSRRTHTQYLSLFKILQSKLSKCRVVPPWAQGCWTRGGWGVREVQSVPQI